MEDGEVFSCSNIQWGMILEAAEYCGWEPNGTQLVDEDGNEAEDWDGAYDSNEGQIVNEIDAENIAKTLENGLKNKADLLASTQFIEDDLPFITNFINWSRIEENGELFAVGYELF
jgi:hypothetical protein